MARKNKYRISWDGVRSWQIESLGTTKKGEEKWYPFRWFGRIDQCTRDLLQLEAGHQSEVTSISEAFLIASQYVVDELRRIKAVD